MARTHKPIDDRFAPPPFWQQLPRMFTYPAHENALIRIACFGIGVTVLQAVPFGFVIALLVWLGFLAFCFGVLERTARGHLLAATLHVDERSGRDPRPLLQLVLVIVFGVLVYAVAASMGPLAAQVAMLVSTALLPASIMILALDEQLLAALNPARIVSTIAGIGLPYLALCAFLFLLLQSSSFAVGALARVLPHWLSALLANMVTMYFLVSIYYLMGYALYQNHAALGIDVQVDPATAGRAVSARGREVDVLDPETQALIADGDLDAAAKRIETRLRREWENDKLHERYHKLLLLLDKPVALERHLNEYVGKLIDAKKPARAVDVYEAAQRKQPGVSLAGPAWLLPLATQAFELRRDATALRLLEGFETNFPGHADSAAVAMLNARILLERQGRYEQAESIFRGVSQRFPSHPLAAEATRLAGVARQMAAVGSETQKV